MTHQGTDMHYAFLRTSPQKKNQLKGKNKQVKAGTVPVSARAIKSVVLVARLRGSILGRS